MTMGKHFRGPISARLLLAMALFGTGAGVSCPVRLDAQQARPELRHGTPGSGRRSTPQSAVPAKREEIRDQNDEYLHSAVVVKLGSMLGMGPNAAATAFTIFNFLILAAGVGALLARMLPRAMRDRSTRIQKQLVEARTATEEANLRLSAVESRLGGLDGQIAEMRAEAEAGVEREAQRRRDSLEEEKLRILAAAEAEISAATLTARRQIQQHAADLAIEHATRKLRVSPETDRAIIENFARQLGGRKDGGN